MSVRDTVRRQIAKQVDTATNGTARDLTTPSEGWIAAMRKALGMTGAQLGRRLGLSRKRISQAEKAEAEGGVTLRSMHEFAKAMDAQFVYAILPKDGTVNNIIKRRAHYKARALVSRVSTHMALEKQALEEKQSQAEIERLTDELAHNLSSDFWEES